MVAAVEKAQVAGRQRRAKEKRRHPPPPFTTSKLQQAAYNRLRYTAKRTMSLAQRLYEGVELGEEGSVALITYMRTDSVNVSSDALAQVREMIPQRFGASYLPEKPNFYKSKKDAQEAHEAVRPTDVMRAPEDVRKYLDDDLFKLYQLIWQRFVASQMLPAVFDQTTHRHQRGRLHVPRQRIGAEIRRLPARLPDAGGKRRPRRRRKGRRGRGRRAAAVSEGQTLRLDRIRPDQHFTEPPPRYNDATLVKELEEKGIGRPSTYASIISTIVEREYVTKDQGRFSPTMLGERVSTLLVKSFEDIFDVTFTARLEEELDEIEEGKLPWREAVKEFWEKFVVDLDQRRRRDALVQGRNSHGKEVREVRGGRIAGAHQPPRFFPGLLALSGLRFHSGSFAGTSRGHRGAQDRVLRQLRQGDGDQARAVRHFSGVQRLSGMQDDAALGGGDARGAATRRAAGREVPGLRLATGAQRHGRYGEFIGCSAYPKCKFIRAKTLGIACPKCGTGELLERMAKKGRRRVFYGCNRYPECDFTTPYRPIAEPCPKCGAPFMVEKRSKTGVVRACLKEGCDWEIAAPEEPARRCQRPSPSRLRLVTSENVKLPREYAEWRADHSSRRTGPGRP